MNRIFLRCASYGLGFLLFFFNAEAQQNSTLAPGAAPRRAARVVARGENDLGQATTPQDLSEIAAVAAGWKHSLVLKSDGTVMGGWGDNSEGHLTIPAGLSKVIAIAAGEKHSLALKADGTVVAWGNNRRGQCDVPAGLSGVKAISAQKVPFLCLPPTLHPTRRFTPRGASQRTWAHTEGLASCRIGADFVISDEELLET